MSRTVDGDVARGRVVDDQFTAPGTADVRELRPAEAADRADGRIVVGDIPTEPPGFQNRPGLLAELDRADARVSVLHALTELHGLGTTQLAAAYARAKLAAGWRLVAWVNGADTTSLLAGLATVADVLEVPGGDPGSAVSDRGTAVRQWLEANGDQCLLVFDDVSDPEIVRRFVPAGRARVLIASRQRPAADLGRAIPVDVFSADEAAAFLSDRVGRYHDAGTTEVAAALGYLPLALALAASVVAGQPRGGYAWYLDRLQAVSADVSLVGDDGQPYPAGLVRAMLLSLQAVRAADRTGVCLRVLEVMAGLSPAGVHRELLYSAGQAGVLASGGRLVTAALVDRVLEWLSGRSLLTFSQDGQTVVMNRLVARVIRNGLVRRGRMTAAYEAAAFVLDVYSRELVGSPDRRAIRGILQQVTALLDNPAGPGTEINDELVWVLLRLRFVAFYHALELGDSTPLAIAVGEPLVEDLGRLLGPDHADTLNSRNSLAAAYLAAGRVDEAIPLFEQILAMRQRTLGPDDSETLVSRNNLASAYQDAGRIDEAIRLYELNLEVRERLLGPDHPSTMNSRGNLAAAYRDGGRVGEAIPLLEQTLAGRERVLGTGHPDTQATRRRLAAAYQDAGRAAEAVPLLERSLADRKPVLRLGQPDTQAPPEEPAEAGPRAERVVDAITPPEPAPATRQEQPSDATRPLPAVGFRRPPAASARRALPAGFRRPPVASARSPLPSGATRRPVRSAGRAPSGQTVRPQLPPEDIKHDGELAAGIAARERGALAAAYDKYAAVLYGYSHWILHDPVAAARAVTDTFVVAAETAGHLSEPASLRPWLFALARRECRLTRPSSAARAEQAGKAAAVDELPGADEGLPDATVQFQAVGPLADVGDDLSDTTLLFRAVRPAPDDGSDATVRLEAVGPLADLADDLSDATVQFRAAGRRPAASDGPADATVQFRAVGRRPAAGDDQPDATVQFKAVGRRPAASDGPADATVQFRAVGRRPAASDEPADATMQFKAVGRRPAASDDLTDATMQLQVIGQLADPITPFRMIGQPSYLSGHGRSEQGQAELQSLIHAVLAGLRPAEREVIELIFRHHLSDDDLAIVLGTTASRSHDLAARARSRLEEALGALHIALTGREACPELGELLADWDGQLTEETRDLVVWHIGECPTCARRGWGAMRPAAFARLLPSAPLPEELREQVLNRCTSTAPDAVAYRRRVVRRARRVRLARYSRAIRRASWSSIRANPGRAVAAVAIVLWAVAAVIVTMLTFGGFRAAQAQSTRPASSPAAQVTPASAATHAGRPAASTETATASARPSPAITQSLADVPTPGQTVPSPAVATTPAPSRSASSSPSPSKSPAPSRSGSPSPSSSHPASPSPPPSTSPAA